jgi:hypothetical protein
VITISRRQIFFAACTLSLPLVFTLTAQAAEPRDPISNFLLFTTTNSLDYQVTETPAPHSSDPSILENRASGNFIVHQTPTDIWSVHQSVSEFNLSQSPIIAQTGLSVPESLWDVETGGAYRHHMGDRHDWGVSTSIGSASDKLFNSIHETIFRATATYHIPSGQENAWLFFLSYSNNRHFANNIPLPGAAYVIHSQDHQFDAAIGLPFLALDYRPAPRWNMRFSIFGPDNVSSEVGYRLWGPVQTYAGFDWGQQEWLRADRADNSDRLFYDQKKWAAGLRFPVYKAVRLDLSGNYEFNRRFYENDRAENRDIPEVNLSPGWAFQAKLSTRW